MVLAAAILGAGRAWGGTVYWDGGTSFNWTTAANWSDKSLPGSADNVVLNESPYGSPYTVDLSASESINSLTTDATSNLDVSEGSLSLGSASQINSTLTLTNQGAISATGNLTLAGVTNWDTGTMGSTGTTYISSGTTPNTAALNITNGNGAYSPQLTGNWENDGSVVWKVAAGTIFFPGENAEISVGGNFNNKGTFTTSGNYVLNYIGSATGAFNNSGTFVNQSATTVFIENGGSGPMPFNNSGTVDAKSGTVGLRGGGTDTGSFTLEANGGVGFAGTTTLTSTSTISGLGTLYFTLAGTTTDAGTVSVGNAHFDAGTATFNNSFTASATTTIDGGTANFNKGATLGSLALSSGAISGNNNITVAGNLNWTGGFIDSGSTIISSSGAAPNSATMTITSGYLDGVLENDGSATWSTGQINFENGTFNNNGAFTGNTGTSTIKLSGSAAFGQDVFNNAGTLICQGTGTLAFYPNISGNSGSTVILNNTGTVDVQSGTLLLSFVDQIGTSVITGGTWDVRNKATLSTAATTDITTINSGASVLLDGANSTFSRINWLSTNQGNFTITNGRSFTVPSATPFSNSGTLKIGPTAVFEAAGTFTNTGKVDVAGGTLKLDKGLASSTVHAELLSGFNHGAWNGTGIISSLAAADPTHSTGVGYTLNSSAYILMDTWYGDTDLSGTVTNSDLLAMVPGATNATWQQGDFNYDGIVNADDYALFQLGDANQTGSFPAVPEPGMVVAGLALFGALRRRSR
jgi:hypothetical protein